MGSIKHVFIASIFGMAVTCQVLNAQERNSSEWVHIAQNSDGTMFYSSKKGSYELTSTKGGAAIAIILGQIEDKKAKEVSYRKWYVTTADCEAGVGKLVILKVDGIYDMETDYVSNGNSISSDIGDVICGIYFDNKKAQEEKGL